MRVSAHRTDGTGVQYRGSLIYTKEADGSLELDCALTSGGRIANDAGTLQVQHFIRDHLGSVRTIVDGSTGDVLETSDYLPFGKRWELTGGQSSQTVTDPTNRWRFSGKETQSFYNPAIPYNDFGAMLHDPRTGRWLAVDPMAEMYYFSSCFSYCVGNPIRIYDKGGLSTGDFVNEKGVLIGNDGHNDGKVYVLKTTTQYFGKNEDDIYGNGITRSQKIETTDFIKNNSGNASAFDSNSIAYENSIEIEGSRENRQKAIDIISKDNGNGGTRDENNREYGGHFTKEGVREVEAGPVAKPGDKNVSVTLSFPYHTFHSHPSGGNTGGFLQFPSKTDLDNTCETTSYVFGRGNNTTYIFNSSGVLATIPTSRFVDFKRPKK